MNHNKTWRNVIIAAYVLIALLLFGFGGLIGITLTKTIYLVIGLALIASFFIVKGYRTNREFVYYGSLAVLLIGGILFVFGVKKVPDAIVGVLLLLVAFAIGKNYM